MRCSDGLYLPDLIQLILRAFSPNATAQPTGDVVPPHGILDNSALAAVELPNGDRRVFFQENNGNIREAVYQESSKQWSLGLTNNVTSDAKRLTPLAAIAHNKTAGPDGGISINTVDIFTRVL